MNAGKEMLGRRSCWTWVAAKMPAPNRPTTASTTTAPSLRDSRVIRYMAGSPPTFNAVEVLHQEQAEMPELGELGRLEYRSALRLSLRRIPAHDANARQAAL